MLRTTLLACTTCIICSPWLRCAVLSGKTPAPMINMKAITKADVMTAVRQSFDFGEAVLTEFNDRQLDERVMPPPCMGRRPAARA
jgi:hypothetical protein